MRIVYLGSGEFGIACLNALAGSAHELAFIVTQPSQPAGRGRKECTTPVCRWANTHSIPFIETDNVNTPEMLERIANYQPDLVVVIAFGQKISAELINLPPKGAINVHASLLPKYRGAAPINWAVINGETSGMLDWDSAKRSVRSHYRMAASPDSIEMCKIRGGRVHETC